MEAPERGAVAQEIIFAFDLRGIPLHDEFHLLELRRAQNVLQLNEAFEFDIVTDGHDAPGVKWHQCRGCDE